MSRLLIISAAATATLDLVLIPLPGPGHPVLILGVIALVVGAVPAATSSRGRRQTP